MDYVKGQANYTIAVEPSKIFQKTLQEHNHVVYSYVADVCVDKSEEVDIACSFDVIEHVEDVVEFVTDIYSCLHSGSQAIIGTPALSEAYADTLGDVWHSFNFRTQHISYFTKESLQYLFNQAGFKDIVIKNVHRYDLGNLISWCLYKEPKGNVSFPWISETLNSVFRKELAAQGMGDYLIVYAIK